MQSKKYWIKAAILLSSVSCFLFLFSLSTTQCQAKGQVRWFNSLGSGLAYAKKAKKWVFVDIGAEW